MNGENYAGTFWRHDKTGIVYRVADTDDVNQVATIANVRGGTMRITFGQLENLYSATDDADDLAPFETSPLSIGRLTLE